MNTKICSDCQKELPLTSFSSNKYKKDGLQYSCKECHSQYRKEHYERNKSKYIDKAKRITRQLKDWYKDYKSNLSCLKCGENHPACLQFHHRDRNTKIITVSEAVIQKGWSKERVLEEIMKCDVLCANCHAKEHYQAPVA